MTSSVAPTYRTITSCRVCGGSRLTEFLDLGATPLANAVRAADDDTTELRVPLAVRICEDCALVQLSTVVAPEGMFRRYVYRSGISDTFRRHCASFAGEAQDLAKLPASARIIDIGGNDGTLLEAFRARGHRTYLVDPAENLAAYARGGGHEVLSAFWGRASARAATERWGAPDLITATNVVAHVDDLDDFFGGVSDVLAPEGRFVVEVPYLADLVEKNEFDTIYHEHLSYFLLRPLLVLAQRHALASVYVRRIPIHGGGLRVYFRRAEAVAGIPETARATLSFEEEAGLYGLVPYRRFAREILEVRRDLRDSLARLRAEGKRVAAYGASAKGATLLNSSGVEREMIAYIVDDTPEKQGYRAPGTGIPIVPAARLAEDPPDFLLILAWNFVDEILAKTHDFAAQGGRYIVPVPALRFLA